MAAFFLGLGLPDLFIVDLIVRIWWLELKASCCEIDVREVGRRLRWLRRLLLLLPLHWLLLVCLHHSTVILLLHALIVEAVIKVLLLRLWKAHLLTSKMHGTHLLLHHLHLSHVWIIAMHRLWLLHELLLLELLLHHLLLLEVLLHLLLLEALVHAWHPALHSHVLLMRIDLLLLGNSTLHLGVLLWELWWFLLFNLLLLFCLPLLLLLRRLSLCLQLLLLLLLLGLLVWLSKIIK